jgi:hypothetical protein
VLRISQKGGGWFDQARAVAGDIPNLHVLLAIIDQVAGVKTRS